MKFTAKQFNPATQSTGCLVVCIFQESNLTSAAKQIDEASGGYISQLLQNGDFSGECGQSLLLHHVPKLSAQWVLLLGCGSKSEFNARSFQKVITQSVTVLKTTAIKEVVYYFEDLAMNGCDVFWKIQRAIEIINDKVYCFDQFKSKKQPELRALQDIVFNVNSAEIATVQQKIIEAETIVKGINFAKDLGNLPPNICTPNYLANCATEFCQKYSTLEVHNYDETKIKEMGMGALLAVASGSHQPPKLIVMEYHGAEKDKKPIVFVGKGVTFDTGGISLKPGANMDEMKFDMCGAASVFGVMKFVAEMQLPINVVGVIPAVENMPGGEAARPGDIVTTMSGQTVEILNTDAEGRLILCDALTFCEKFNPDCVIDIATLTGAMIITLGTVASGLMVNHSPLAAEFERAAQQSGDKIWELPIWDDYQDLINSPFADMANIGEGMGAKSIVAGCFLSRFTKKFHWAHLDTAGTAWRSGKEKSSTGRPVALLAQFLLNRDVKN